MTKYVIELIENNYDDELRPASGFFVISHLGYKNILYVITLSGDVTNDMSRQGAAEIQL